MQKAALASLVFIGAIVAAGFVGFSFNNPSELDLLLCEDALMRRRATEQDFTRIVSTPGGDFLAPLTSANMFTYERVGKEFAKEVERLNEIMTEAISDAERFCGKPSPPVVSLSEEARPTPDPEAAATFREAFNRRRQETEGQ